MCSSLGLFSYLTSSLNKRTFSVCYPTYYAVSRSDSKASACNEGDPGSIPGSGRSPGEGNGNPLQYSCLENSMDGGAWWTTVHGGKESDRTSLSLSLSDNKLFNCRAFASLNYSCFQTGERARALSEWLKSLSRVWLFATPWTVACQAPPSMGFSRSRLPRFNPWAGS